MDYNDMKEVDYFTYCSQCEHKELGENESPCDECLEEPLNEGSTKPIHFVRKERK